MPVTVNYGWKMPTLGADPTTWGSELNTTIGAIDGQVKTNENATTTIQGFLTPNQLILSRTGTTGYSSILLTNADTGGTGRWQIYSGDAVESGGNVGSDLVIQAFNDTGAYLGWAMSFSRVTQRVAISSNPVSYNDIANKGYVDSAVNLGAPIGSIVMWGSKNLPSNWTWCLGQHYAYTAVPALFNVIGGTFFWDGTNFGVPNLAGRMALGYDGGGWSMGRLDGEYSHALSWGETGAHYHNVPDPQHYHNISQGSHTHGDYGHGHGVNDPSHVHGNVETHGGGQTIIGGSQWGAIGNTASATTGISIATGYANLAASGTGVGNTDYALTRISTTDTQGSGSAHNNMQPSIVLGYIIRYV